MLRSQLRFLLARGVLALLISATSIAKLQDVLNTHDARKDCLARIRGMQKLGGDLSRDPFHILRFRILIGVTFKHFPFIAANAELICWLERLLPNQLVSVLIRYRQRQQNWRS